MAEKGILALNSEFSWQTRPFFRLFGK